MTKYKFPIRRTPLGPVYKDHPRQFVPEHRKSLVRKLQERWSDLSWQTKERVGAFGLMAAVAIAGLASSPDVRNYVSRQYENAKQGVENMVEEIPYTLGLTADTARDKKYEPAKEEKRVSPDSPDYGRTWGI
jgi:hypothetical protein